MNVPDSLPKRSTLFLLLGILCYSSAGLLSWARDTLVSSALLSQLSLFLELLIEYLWSVPSALIIFLVLGIILGLYYGTRARGKKVRCLLWLDHPSLPSWLKFLGVLLCFIYTILPLQWAQRTFTRSPESFPDYAVFHSIVILLSLLGTIFCCLYLFENLPLKIVYVIKKVMTRFYKLKEKYLIGSLFVLCFLTTGIIAYTVLDHIPHILDSIAQLFHAKIYLMGKLYAPLPPLKEFFDYAHIINDTKWYSQYPPGHSFLLMLGLLMGAPWIIGPLLGALSLLIFYHITKNIYHDRRTSYLSTSLLLLSPFFLFMSSSHMNHTSTMFFILVFLYSYQRIFSSHAFTPAIIAGLSIGYAITIRPLTAGAIGLPFIYYLLFSVYRNKEVPVKNVLIFLAGLSTMVSLLLLYNELTNGAPFSLVIKKNTRPWDFWEVLKGGHPNHIPSKVV